MEGKFNNKVNYFCWQFNRRKAINTLIRATKPQKGLLQIRKYFSKYENLGRVACISFYILSGQIISLPNLWTGSLFYIERLITVIPHYCFYKEHSHLSWLTGGKHLSCLSFLYRATVYTSVFTTSSFLKQEPILHEALSSLTTDTSSWCVPNKRPQNPITLQQFSI